MKHFKICMIFHVICHVFKFTLRNALPKLQEISRLEGATDVCYPDGLQSQEEREEAVKAAEERGNRFLEWRKGGIETNDF